MTDVMGAREKVGKSKSKREQEARSGRALWVNVKTLVLVLSGIGILGRREMSSSVHVNGVTPAALWRRGLPNNPGER